MTGVTTTVRISTGDYQWVREHRLVMSAILRSKIHELQIEGTGSTIARFVRIAREFGMTDIEIAPILERHK